MLMFGNGGVAEGEVAHRRRGRETIDPIRDVRNTAIMVKALRAGAASTPLVWTRRVKSINSPSYGEDLPCADNKPVAEKSRKLSDYRAAAASKPWEKPISCCHPLKGERRQVLYAHASYSASRKLTTAARGR